MTRKTIIALSVAFCLSLSACAKAPEESSESPTPAPVEEGRTILPLPDSTMDNLTDAILSVSFEEGSAYVDDQGRMQLDVKIYSYDKYDMVDIAGLKLGDKLSGHAGEVEITAMERDESGRIHLNGGLEKGGFDLVTDDCGIFFEQGYNDSKSWYELGQATIRVSADFIGRDNADLDQGELIIYPGDFLVGAVTNYYFTPHNTTIRVESGQIVELERRYVP